jgi:hypothetical protein
MLSTDTELSIGMLAYNEEPRIREALQTLFTQDVFKQFATEVVIVPNGCTDGTAGVASQIVESYRPELPVCCSARVVEIQTAGKSNAWNQFVQKLSARTAKVLVLMDADVVLLGASTISSMVNTLTTNPEAVVCVDRPVKDIAENPNSIFQRLLARITPEINPNNIPLCAQLYCAYSGELRRITLPVEITVEDGFLRALLLTRGFTQPEDLERIVLDSNSKHRFASVATLREAFRHEMWIVTGSIINMSLFRLFSANCSGNLTAMRLMDAKQAQNVNWLKEYVQQEVKIRGWRLLPKDWWVRRWSRLKRLSVGKKLLQSPITLAAAGMDAVVFVAAIWNLRRGAELGSWWRT